MVIGIHNVAPANPMTAVNQRIGALCAGCGRPNLFATQSIASGNCAACVKAAARTPERKVS